MFLPSLLLSLTKDDHIPYVDNKPVKGTWQVGDLYECVLAGRW